MELYCCPGQLVKARGRACTLSGLAETSLFCVERSSVPRWRSWRMFTAAAPGKNKNKQTRLDSTRCGRGGDPPVLWMQPHGAKGQRPVTEGQLKQENTYLLWYTDSYFASCRSHGLCNLYPQSFARNSEACPQNAGTPASFSLHPKTSRKLGAATFPFPPKQGRPTPHVQKGGGETLHKPPCWNRLAGARRPQVQQFQ